MKPCGLSLLAVILALHCSAAELQVEDATHLVNLIKKDDFKYPKEWLDKCGDGKGNITVFNSARHKFEKCYLPLFNEESFAEEIGTALSEEKMGNFTRYQCYKMNPLYDCITGFVQAIQHCFTEDDKDRAWTLVRMVKALMDFVCFEDGKHVLIFLQDEGMTCAMDSDRQEKWKECIDTSNIQDLVNGSLTDKLVAVRTLKFDEDNCRSLIQTSDCMTNVTRTCPERTSADLMIAIGKAILKETPCTKYMTSSAIRRDCAITITSIATILVFIFHYVRKS